MSTAVRSKQLENSPQRRFQKHFSIGPSPEIGLPVDHPAPVEGRTLFPGSVVFADEAPRLLVSGANQRKIGDRVSKGKWAGMPIFCLTLEERATCPRTCDHWLSCYGNGMPRARRHRRGPDLEFLLHAELEVKQEKFPEGFVVRLHILGDFYDIAYIYLWRRWLSEFPALRIFGYTAHDRAGPLGRAVNTLNDENPGRCAIRFSTSHPDQKLDRWATTIWREPEARVVPEGIVCPAQTGATECCGTCALCWASPKTIVFVVHGQKFHHGGGKGPSRPQAT